MWTSNINLQLDTDWNNDAFSTQRWKNCVYTTVKVTKNSVISQRVPLAFMFIWMFLLPHAEKQSLLWLEAAMLHIIYIYGKTENRDRFVFFFLHKPFSDGLYWEICAGSWSCSCVSDTCKGFLASSCRPAACQRAALLPSGYRQLAVSAELWSVSFLFFWSERWQGVCLVGVREQYLQHQYKLKLCLTLSVCVFSVVVVVGRRIALLRGSDRQPAKQHSHEGKLAVAHLFQIG